MNTLFPASTYQQRAVFRNDAELTFRRKDSLRPITVAIASMLVALIAGPSAAQTSASSNNRIGAVPSGGLTSSPASYLLLPTRIRSSVGELKLTISANQFPADGVTPIDVIVEVLDSDGKRVTLPVDATVQVTAGARIVAAANTLTDANTTDPDVDKIAPGLQLRNRDGVLKFRIIAPV